MNPDHRVIKGGDCNDWVRLRAHELFSYYIWEWAPWNIQVIGVGKVSY